MSHPLIVTVAIVRKRDHILITRRPEGSRDAGKWEFPGGKLDGNESPEEGLKRELIEELNLPVSVGSVFDIVYHDYQWGSVLLLVYNCLPLSEEIENLQVAEHRYVSARELKNYDLLEADRPLIMKLSQP